MMRKYFQRILFIIPLLVKLRFKVHTSLLNEEQKIRLDEVLKKFNKVQLTEEIKEIAIEYKIQYNLKTPDAILPPLAFQMPLVTGHKKVIHVENIITVFFNPAV